MSVTYYNIYIIYMHIFPIQNSSIGIFFVYSTFSDAPDTARFRSKTWHLWDAKEIMQRWIPEWMNSASVWWQFLVAPTLITLLGSMGQATLSPKTTGWYSDFLVSSHDNTDDHLAWKTFILGSWWLVNFGHDGVDSEFQLHLGLCGQISETARGWAFRSGGPWMFHHAKGFIF